MTAPDQMRASVRRCGLHERIPVAILRLDIIKTNAINNTNKIWIYKTDKAYETYFLDDNNIVFIKDV